MPVIWHRDRFMGRTAKGLTALFAELLERRVNLVSLRDSIDLNTPGVLNEPLGRGIATSKSG